MSFSLAILLTVAAPAQVRDVNEGSVQEFASAIAVAAQTRAKAESVNGAVRVVVDSVRGLDRARVQRALMPRIKAGLVKGPLISTEGPAPLLLSLSLSEEQGQLWAVGVISGPRLVADTTIAVRRAIDRELASALGAASQKSMGRLLIERIGVLPLPHKAGRQCAVLDALLVDAYGAGELAVLSTCGVTFHRTSDAPELVMVAAPYALPQRPWPRIVVGWLAQAKEPNVLWATTSAGHSVLVDYVKHTVTGAPTDRAPLRGVTSKDGPFSLHTRLGSPALELPLVTPGSVDVLVAGLPGRVRDLWRLPGERWLFVGDDGALFVRDEAGGARVVSPERAGDRVLVVDLDGDGEVEVITTSSAPPGEPDQLVVRRLAQDGSSVLMKSPLGGGSITALAASPGARGGVVALEELPDGQAVVWHLDRAP